MANVANRHELLSSGVGDAAQSQAVEGMGGDLRFDGMENCAAKNYLSKKNTAAKVAIIRVTRNV